jgi:hypothetical protein
MVVPKLEKQQVIGALKATGSSDPDVLFARKEELLAESKKVKILGIAPIIVGVVVSLSIIGAVVGIPAILSGSPCEIEFATTLQPLKPPSRSTWSTSRGRCGRRPPELLRFFGERVFDRAVDVGLAEV